MPAFYMIPCTCGRQLRAEEKQAGLTLRCWGCGAEVVVPLPRHKGRLAREVSNVTRDALRSDVVMKALAWGTAVAAALSIPQIGPALGVAAMVIAAWAYQDLFTVPRPPRRFARADDQVREGEDEPEGTTLAPGWRLLLALLGVAALLAPFVVRNGGRLLPGDSPPAYARPLSALAYLGWLVMPLVLVAANAQGRRGQVPAGRVFGGLSRHPRKVIEALMLLPVGLAALEGFLVLLLVAQNFLPLFVEELFPRPEHEMVNGTAGLMFRYDREEFHTPFYNESVPVLGIYGRGLRHGFNLVSTIPASLPYDRPLRANPDFFRSSEGYYQAMRVVFSVIILAGTALLLNLQARWLALVASTGETSGATEAPPAADTLRQPMAAAAAPAPAPPAAVLADAPSPAEDGGGGSPATPLPVPLSTPPPGSIPVPGPSAFQVAILGTMPNPAAVAGAPAPPAHRTGLPVILIVDDERPFTTALGRVLADRGYAVHLANDAQDGLRLASATRPDLIMLDLLLPDRSGLEVCRELRADPKTRSIPIVIATYKGDSADEVAGLEAGADDYVIKPYVLDVLLARIKKQLQRTRA